MSSITSAHFGGNIILTNDSAKDGSPFREMLSEVRFTNLRYPGGGVTEDQTWENDGLQKMFGGPMEPGTDGYVMTIREALQLCEDNGSSMSVVIPTFQFFDVSSKTFDHSGFDRYLSELEGALSEHPGVPISAFEIGNEYWAEISATDYGRIAEIQLPLLDGLRDRLADHLGSDWEAPAIGIQAGAAWRWSGENESRQIADEISVDHRELVDIIYQHAYPNPNKGFDGQLDGVMKPVAVFETLPGFKDDLKLSLSEFNMGIHAGDAPNYGVNQGAYWIEEFARHVDAGADEMDHWGLAYKWLTTKYYDTKFPPAESDNGAIQAIATPMGQIYDLASSHLVGKSTMSDEDAIEGMQIDGKLGITGFEEDGERMVFLSNMSGEDATVDLSSFADKAVFAHHIVAADSPKTPWYDESTNTLPSSDVIVDARADMKVVSGDEAKGEFTLGPNEMLVVIVGDPDRDYVIEGAHKATDPDTGQVDDHIIGADGQDILRGHAGNDTLEGGKGDDVLVGGRGDNELIGGEGKDVLISDGGGSDTLSGGEGDDVMMIGGRASDEVVTASTGEGRDMIVTDGSQNIEILDFTSDDTLAFGGLFADPEAFMAAMRVSEQDLVIDLPDGKTVSLIGGAGLEQTLVDQAFDFKTSPEAEEQVDWIFEGLSPDQHLEVHDRLEGMARMPHHEESVWRDRIEELEEPTDPVPPEEPERPSDPNEPTDPADPNDPDLPTRPDWPDDEENYPPDDDHLANDGGSGGGACFVATAAYGDPHHPDVVDLRAFRDRVLVNYRTGRAFIRFYWKVGPVMARVTSPKNLKGRCARFLLSRLVRKLRKMTPQE